MSLWTVQQHEWLEALGHPVLLLAGDPALTASAPAPAAAAAPPAATPVEIKRADPVADHPPVPQAKPPGKVGIDVSPATKKTPDSARPRTDAAAKKAALDAARRASRPARPAGQAQPDALLAAIARVTGLDATAADQLMATQSVDLEKLRTDPSAKRALWLQLRRQQGGRNR